MVVSKVLSIQSVFISMNMEPSTDSRIAMESTCLLKSKLLLSLMLQLFKGLEVT